MEEYSVGRNNLRHVLEATCTDPDCELHSPSVIEDENSRLTAIAWLLVGAECATDVLASMKADAVANIRDELLHACGLNPDGSDEQKEI